MKSKIVLQHRTEMSMASAPCIIVLLYQESRLLCPPTPRCPFCFWLFRCRDLRATPHERIQRLSSITTEVVRSRSGACASVVRLRCRMTSFGVERRLPHPPDTVKDAIVNICRTGHDSLVDRRTFNSSSTVGTQSLTHQICTKGE